MVVADELDWHAMVAAIKSRKEGTEVVSTTTPDPPQVGGVKEVLETDKKRSQQNVGTVAGGATERASARRSTPIRTDSDPVEPNMEINIICTTWKGQKDRKPTIVMKHKENLMKNITSKLSEVWYVDFGASNHMMSHEEWFSYLEKLEQLRVVKLETTPHI